MQFIKSSGLEYKANFELELELVYNYIEVEVSILDR